MSRTLLVASPGGHVDELFEFAPRLRNVGENRVWVTTATPQTTRLLANEKVEWVPAVASRQGIRAAASFPLALALMRRHRPSLVVSTGAAMAIPYLVAARIHGLETHYIESATRLEGPSVTGRLMALLPGTGLHHQGFHAPVSRWRSVGSVFDSYSPGPLAEPAPIRRAVLLLGTERYPFSRALRQVGAALPAGVEVLRQTGHTPVGDSDQPCRPWVPGDELADAVAQADVVITHAGVGSVLSTLRAGKHPIVLPRSASLGEHVDDHQRELADHLAGRGLASIAVPDQDLGPIIAEASRRTTVADRSHHISL